MKNQRLTFTKWGEGQPDKSIQDTGCTMLSENGIWQVTPECSMNAYIICQLQKNPGSLRILLLAISPHYHVYLNIFIAFLFLILHVEKCSHLPQWKKKSKLAVVYELWVKHRGCILQKKENFVVLKMRPTILS